ncbi:MAG TPA: alpha/beta hydrolase [Planctomycetota bacterium]|nr:alpha/beta hydrolase [Planctomycetota bacterium]
MRIAWVALLVWPLGLGAQEKGKPPEEVIFEKDVVYGQGAGEDLKLNLSRPKDAPGAVPCIVFIHGGGWAAGSKDGHTPQTWEVAKRGYVSATVGYRFAPKHRWPAQIEDVKCAIRFLRANAQKYGIDRDRIGAVGFSAGAHLSMLLGTMDPADGFEGEGGSPDQPSRVNAVVSFFGPTDFTTRDWPDASRKLIEQFLGGTREEKAEIFRKASPLSYVKAGVAPMLLIQGTKDRLVPYAQAYAMTDALSLAGVPGRLDLIVGADHGWGNPELQRTIDETYAFFEQYLKGKKK